VRKVLQFIGAKFFYDLDKKTLAQMETELKEKLSRFTVIRHGRFFRGSPEKPPVLFAVR
jgi:hypothetical protein